MQPDYDLVVAGGGINGVAIARDAAGRGARVLLVEQDDLAAHTSSASTKLIHGGLRYLEHYQFRLVAEALAERERLMGAAPHLIRPLRFALPHDRAMRPGWMMRIGLFLYDRLGGRSSLPRSRAIPFRDTPYGTPLKADAARGYLYSDCWGDDSRLTLSCALDAAAHGARIRARTRLRQARRIDGYWQVALERKDGDTETVTARSLVNATGAWAQRFLTEQAGLAPSGRLRLVKGSHIVTPRLFDGDHAYMLQNTDRRIVFVIPYESRFTLVGTTDIPVDGPIGKVAIDAGEIDYLCSSVNRWFNAQIGPTDVVSAYSGVRPLYDNNAASPSEVSRDYVLALDTEAGAPILSVFGGKITTHRALAEHAMDKLSTALPDLGPAWTGTAILPGGDLGSEGLDGLMRALGETAPFLDPFTVRRLAESYGTIAFDIVGNARTLTDLGAAFGAGLTEAELNHLVANEWALTAEDILWRRSKLGLHLTGSEVEAVSEWVAARVRPHDVAPAQPSLSAP
ncbi:MULTISPECIES: glycerol-3-phosphate dehydrogenase [unclassified Sphingomonas]|uniref:glycerol-3-phosphate dehydrogenase n=1 Tax=unclassified Sphingomonas TaxID=196159 RepID=UPI002151665B|nr:MULTISPECIES: glycerol-3-phosphate dehydrogenase [unclassified Sphingomonas]MCR5871109.1 glycerol-3-phosphate dehydrogenase [Sphingomonas sp. J344]UUY00575.1 glycerol-3-phosphate dehydrogenase [Sphingomonas sp. J315]